VPNVNTLFAYLKSTSTVPYIIAGGVAALYSSAGLSTGFFDITPVAVTNASYWALDTWGDTLLAAPSAGGLYASNGTAVAAIVATAPASMNQMLVTSQRQVLALGCNEEISTTFNPMCIRGCDLEDYTDWTTTSANNAFEHILEGEGKIIAGRRIGSYVAVWTNAALHLGQFIGDPQQTYRFDLVAGGCGLVGQAAVEILNGVAYWMSPDHRFYRWVPGELPVQIPCPISRDLQDNISAGTSRLDQSTRAVRNAAFGEVWWFYPDTRDSAGRRYVAFNTVEGLWFRGVLDRRAVFHGDFLYNPAATSGVRAWRPVISADSTGAIYSHEVEAFGGAGDGEAGFSSFIQSADQYVESGRRRVMITGLNPDLEQQLCAVDLTLYMKDRPRSTPVTKGPYSLATTANKKNFRASGMIMSVKISLTTNIGTNLTESWRLGKPVFRGATMGER